MEIPSEIRILNEGKVLDIVAGTIKKAALYRAAFVTILL